MKEHQVSRMSLVPVINAPSQLFVFRGQLKHDGKKQKNAAAQKQELTQQR